MELIRKLFSGVLLLLVFSLFQLVNAQTANDYFHNGAQQYIGGNLNGAISEVETGLINFPNDPKLNSLLEKLLEEQEQQQQNQQDQENQEQEEQNQENQQQQNEDQEQQEQEQQENEQEQNEEQQEQEQQQSQAQQPREISKEEAEKILQALAQKEKELLKEFKKQKPQGSTTHDKDW